MRKVLCALAAVALVTGCAGEAKDDSAAAPLSAARPEPAMEKSVADQGSGTNDSLQSAPNKAAPNKAQNVEVKRQSPADQRAVVYTATLRVRADKVEDAAAKAKVFVLGAGGYVGSENTGGDPVTAVLTLKIPADQYQNVLNRLATELGKKISLEQSAEDVTEQVADVDSRIRSAKSALDRLRTLLGQAKTVGEVLRVSDEIDTRQADLEALQARQKSLAQRTSFATVTLQIDPPAKPGTPEKKEEDDSGFLAGLSNGWDAFTAFVSGTLTVVGAILPFAGLILLLGIPAFLIERRRRRTRPAPPAPPVEPEPV